MPIDYKDFGMVIGYNISNIYSFKIILMVTREGLKNSFEYDDYWLCTKNDVFTTPIKKYFKKIN